MINPLVFTEAGWQSWSDVQAAIAKRVERRLELKEGDRNA